MSACGIGGLIELIGSPNIRLMASPEKTRRAVVAAIAGLPLTARKAKSGGGEASRASSKVLVAYFSRSGNTRVIAGLLKRAFGAAIFEIQPATPYPEEYLATVKKATEERDRDIEPPLAGKISHIASYDTVYLGFPIWGETAPSIIRSFLKAHDLTGKTLVPFITHGGYGLGDSQKVLANHAPKSRIEKPFVMQADQERRTMESVNAWLQQRAAP